MAADTTLTLQLALKAGETLETGTGAKVVLGRDRIEWGPEKIGGEVRYNGWTLKSAEPLRLVWPVYPYNPYANAPETGLANAVGALATDVNHKSRDTRDLKYTLTTQ